MSLFLLFLVMLVSTSTGNSDVVTRGCISPRTLPHFTVPVDLANAHVISEHDLKGRPAMLVFFSPVRKSSADSAAISQRMFLRFHSRGLAVLGFEVDEAPNPNKNIKPAEHDPAIIRHKLNLGFPVGRDCCGAQIVFCVSDVPTAFFVDRRGKMSKMSPGDITLRSVQH